MKKKSLLWTLAVVLVLVSVQSALGALADDNTRYYKLEETSGTSALDETGNFNGTYNGDVPTNVTGIIDQGQSFDGTGDYINISSPVSGSTGSVSMWVKRPDVGSSNEWMWGNSNIGDENTINAFMFGSSSDGVTLTVGNDAGSKCQTEGSAVDDDAWHHLVFTWDLSGNCVTYIDGNVDVNVSAPGGSFGVFDDFFIGARENGGSPNSPFNGEIDEFSVWDRRITSSEVSELYAGGSPGSEEQYPYTTSNVSVSLSTTGINPSNPESDDTLTDNATYTSANGASANITADWQQNGNSIETDTFTNVANGSTVSAEVNLSDYAVSDGSNITLVWNATSPNASTTTTDGPVQVQDKGFIKIENVTEKITGNSIDTFNLTSPVNASTTNGTLTVEVDIGTQNFTIDASDSGYLNTKTVEATVNFSQTTTINASGFYNVNATIQVNASDGTDVNNYDVVANTTDFNGGIRYDEQKTASGSDVTFQLIAGNWTFNIENATQSGNNYSTATRKIKLNETTTPTLNFTVYLSNSFDLEIRDEQTDTLIDDRNVTLEFISDLEASNYTTSNGTLFVDAFMPAEIEIRYDASGYDERSYYKFLTNQSYNNITLYLLNSSESNTIIVDVIDESGAEVEGVVLQILRGFINGNKQEYKIVEMDKTDFAGEAVIRAELNDPDYKIKVVEDVETNENLFLSDPFEITNTLLEVTVNLLGDPLEGYTRWRDISFDEPVYDNSSKQWNASYTDNAGLINPGGEVCLIVKKSVGVEWQDVGETCSSATSADLTVNYDDPDHGSIAFLIADTNTENSKHVLSSVQTLVGTRNRLAQALGGTGAFLTAGVVYTVGAIFLFNPTTYIVGIILASFASFAIGLLNLTWGAGLSFILIVGMFIALRMRT